MNLRRNIIINHTIPKETRATRGMEILQEIEVINIYLDESENRIKSLERQLKKKGSSTIFQDKEIKMLKSIISKQRLQIKTLYTEIITLKEKNYELTLQINQFKMKLENAEFIMRQNKEQLKKLNAEISEKYCILVLKDNYEKRRVTGNSIKFEKTIKQKHIISDHPPDSYSIQSNHTIKIKDNAFWLNTNYLIVKINKKSCGIRISK